MFQLLRAELRKVWCSRFFTLACIILLCINLFLLWFGTERAPSGISASAYQILEQELRGLSPDETGAFLHAELDRITALNHIDATLRTEAWNGGKQNEALRTQYANEFSLYYEEYTAGQFLHYGKNLAQEYRFLDTLVREYDTVTGYERFLDSIESKAEHLSSISIFAQNGYDIENIRATADAFRNMHGTPILWYPQKGLATALDFHLTDAVTVLAMLLISMVLVRTERDSELLMLIRSTPAGRTHTAFAKIITLGISLGVILLGLYGSNLFYCGSLYGLGPFSRTIQSVPLLMRSTWKLTVAEYLGCFFLTKWLAVFISGLWVMLAMLYAKRLFTGTIGSLALLTINLLIRLAVPAASNINVLKYANLISLLRTNELIGSYRNLYWFGHPVPLLLVEFVSAVLFLVIFLIGFVWLFERHCFKQTKHISLPVHRFLRAPAFTTLHRQEARKLLLMQGAFLVLLLFAALQFYTAASTESYMDANEIYYRSYIKPIEGSLTQEKYDWLCEQNQEFKPLYELDAALRSGRITPEAFHSLMNGYPTLIQKRNAFLRVCSMGKALSQRPHTQMVYESGWLKLFDVYGSDDISQTFSVAILCSVIFSGLFAVEAQTGMIHVIGTTPLGRKATVRAKLLLTLSVCGAITVLSLLPRFWIAVRDYGLHAWSAPIYSIAQFADCPEIPLVFLTFLLVAARYTAVAFMAMTTLFFSQKCANAFGAMFASLTVFALPPLLSLSGLNGAKWLSLYPLFHFPALFAEGLVPFGVMLAVIAAGISFLCREFLYCDFATQSH